MRYRFFITLLLFTFLFHSIVQPAFALLGFGENNEMDDRERQETIERIQDVQNKLKLLQEKLKALERRKAAKQAAEKGEVRSDEPSPSPSQVNWLPVNEETPDPGNFGYYTYVLFNGDAKNMTTVGILEDLILTIETLPKSEIPASLGNRFLVPVEVSQSTIDLGRQPYDFRLNRAYLDRLQLRESLPEGPVLVSLIEAIDPFGESAPPAFMAVSFGRQKPQKTLELTKVWHKQEKIAEGYVKHPLAEIFWELLDEVGTSLVTRFDQRLLIELPAKP